MIARIEGELIEKNPTFVIVDCGGVGYQINVSLQTFTELPNYPENPPRFCSMLNRLLDEAAIAEKRPDSAIIFNCLLTTIFYNPQLKCISFTNYEVQSNENINRIKIQNLL